MAIKAEAVEAAYAIPPAIVLPNEQLVRESLGSLNRPLSLKEVSPHFKQMLIQDLRSMGLEDVETRGDNPNPIQVYSVSRMDDQTASQLASHGTSIAECLAPHVGGLVDPWVGMTTLSEQEEARIGELLDQAGLNERIKDLGVPFERFGEIIQRRIQDTLKDNFIFLSRLEATGLAMGQSQLAFMASRLLSQFQNGLWPGKYIDYYIVAFEE